MEHGKRFAGWRRRLSLREQYLVDQVVGRIVPDFNRNGFVWYPNSGGGSPSRVGANVIPLQRRGEKNWPVVEIYFLSGGGPRFKINFSVLPEICRSIEGVEILREHAAAQYGPAYFGLRRGIWGDYLDSEFGFDWASLLLPSPAKMLQLIRYLINWRRFLDSEVDAALLLLPVLYEIFDHGISQDWLEHDFGKITPNVMLIHSWKLWGGKA